MGPLFSVEQRFLVYALCDPRTTEVRYVGLTTTGLKRARSHSWPSSLRRDSNRHKASWISQVLAAGYEVGVRALEECSSSETVAAAEKRWIATMRSYGCRLTNLMTGGEGSSHSDETCQRLSVAGRGQKRCFSATHRTHLSEAAQLRAATGNMPRGESHGNAKLTADRVVAMRAARADGRTLKWVALHFGVSLVTVDRIARRESWAHVDGGA